MKPTYIETSSLPFKRDHYTPVLEGRYVTFFILPAWTWLIAISASSIFLLNSVIAWSWHLGVLNEDIGNTQGPSFDTQVPKGKLSKCPKNLALSVLGTLQGIIVQWWHFPINSKELFEIQAKSDSLQQCWSVFYGFNNKSWVTAHGIMNKKKMPHTILLWNV